MCGRYALNASAQELIDHFQLVRCSDFPIRFNIAPSASVPVIRQSPDGDRVADLLRWGLIPHWSKDPVIGTKLNNARAESVAEKPSFRDAFTRRRCLIPATGFYEWKPEGKAKKPYFIRFKDETLMAMAGLWESWKAPDGKVVRSFCVITIAPNSVMEPIHDRMPVLVHPGNFSTWLDPEVPGRELVTLLAPYGAGNIEAFPVSNTVSKSAAEGPELIVPIQGE